MAKAEPLSRREFSLAQNDGAMQSNIQNRRPPVAFGTLVTRLSSDIGMGRSGEATDGLQDGLAFATRHSPMSLPWLVPPRRLTCHWSLRHHWCIRGFKGWRPGRGA